MNKLLRAITVCGLSWAALTVQAVTLTGPELESVNWESRQLTAADFNGDGKQDIALINGNERALDVFIQQKERASVEVPHARPNTPLNALTRFKKERVALEAAPSAFALGDFGNNGAQELAYTSKKLGLVFLARNNDGSWKQVRRISDVEAQPFTHTLWSGKLNEKGPVVLVALLKGQLVVICNHEIVGRYGCLKNDPGFLNITDINHDGLMDIVYEYDAPLGVAYRLQTPDGRFDVERLVSYAFESEKSFAFKGDHWFFFGGTAPFVEERKLVDDPLNPQVDIYGNMAEAPSGLLYDIDGDGVMEWVVADAKSSQLTVYKRQGDRWGTPLTFPTLKGVQAMAGATLEGKPALVVYSAEEHAIGVSRWDGAAARLSFPTLVDMPVQPVGLVGSQGRAWVLLQDEKESLLAPLGALNKTYKLGDLKRTPDDLLAYPWGEQTLLVIPQNREMTLFYLLKADGSVKQLEAPAALARANFFNLDASRLGWGDVDGDGVGELLIAQKSTLRLFKIVNGALTLADQALPLWQEANLRLPFVAGGQLWAADAKSQNFLRFERDSKGVWHQAQELSGAPLEPQNVQPLNSEWIVLSDHAFYVLKPNTPRKTLETVERWESKLNVKGYSWGSLEAFDKEGRTAVLFDNDTRTLELVDMQHPFKSVLNFFLYEKDPHFQGRTGDDVEPREIVSADVTGDGKADLVVLMHDKIGVYPQR